MSHRAPLFIRLALCAVLISQSTAASAQAVVARVVVSPGVRVAPAGVGLSRPAALGLAAPASLPSASLLPLSPVPGLAVPSAAAARAARAQAAVALPAAVVAPAARTGSVQASAAADAPVAAPAASPLAAPAVRTEAGRGAAGVVSRVLKALPSASMSRGAPSVLNFFFDRSRASGGAVLPANAALPSAPSRGRLQRSSARQAARTAALPAPRPGALKPSLMLGAASLVISAPAAAGLGLVFATLGFPSVMLVAHSLLARFFPDSGSGLSSSSRWMLSAAAGLGFGAYAYAISLLSPWAAAASVTAAFLSALAVLVRRGAAKMSGSAAFPEDGFLKMSRDAKGAVLLTLRESDFDKPMMLNATLEKGVGSDFLYSMAPLTEAMVYFRRSGDRVQLMRKNMAFRAAPGSADAKVVERSFADSMIASVPVTEKDGTGKAVTVSFEELLRADLFDLKGILAANYPDSGEYALSKDLSRVVSAKAFPKNAELSAELLFQNPDPGAALPVPDARNLMLQVRYGFSALPEPGFEARRADDRVGFFTTVYRELNDLASAPAGDVPYTNLVQRWRLEKSDPSAALSPVKKPIVWWLENSIPAEHRAAVREGILKWNAAFERLGFKDAIVVRQQPDPGVEPADQDEAQFDAADVRYNVAHWFTGSDADIAFAQWRSDPRTGEIYNGHVNFSLQVLDGRGYRGMKDLLEGGHAHKHGPSCRLGREVAEHLAGLKDSGMSPDARRRFAHELVVSYIVHEFGHALGLRHNFAATGMRTLAEIAAAKDGIVSQSVMDYAAISIPSDDNPDGTYVQTELGPYDYLAIDYGYRPLEGLSPERARSELARIAGRVGEPGLEYATDEQVDGTDPYAAQFDFGPEPLEYAAFTAQRGRRLIAALADRELDEGADYGALRREFMRLFKTQVLGAFRLVLPYVGGVRVNRVRAGQNDGKLPYEAVGADKQRAALRFLAENLFSDEGMSIPKGLLAKLAPDLRETDPGYLPDPALFPYEENVTDVRKWAIESLLSVDRLKRMAETRQLADGPTYSVPELFRDLSDAVWSETASRKTAVALAISPLRRRAQAALTEHLLRVIRGSSALEDDERGGLREPANPYSSEAVAAARTELSRLSNRIASLLEKARKSKTFKADPAVIGHLENTYQRISSLLRD